MKILSFLSVFSIVILISSCGSSSDTTGEINSGKYYKIVSVNSGKCLDVRSKEDGERIIQCNCNHSDKQKFKLSEVENEDGIYFILNKYSNKNIDIAGGNMDDGGQVVQWTSNNGENQKFALLSVSGNKYNIISKNSNKLLDVTGQSKEDSVPLVQWGANGQDNQVFELIVEE